MKIAYALLLSAAALGVPGLASAQQAPAPDMRTLVNSAEIKAMIADAAATIKPGQPVLVKPLLDFAPYKIILEYRQGAAGAAIHKKETEVFHVLEGGGTLTEGGTITGVQDDNDQNTMGTAISGGTSRHIAAGDVLIIPEGTSHWFNKVDGRLVMVVMKVPRPVPGN